MTQANGVALHKKVSPTVRDEALRLAAEHGPAEASRRTGIPAATIRSWRRRVGESGPPAGVDPVAWADLKETAARDIWEAAQMALSKVRELLEVGEVGDAQRGALALAILLDKSLVLEAAAIAATNRRVRLAQDSAQHIVEVLTVFLVDALGLPFSEPVRKTLAGLLRQAAAGTRLAANESSAAEAHAEIRRWIAAELERDDSVDSGAFTPC